MYTAGASQVIRDAFDHAVVAGARVFDSVYHGPERLGERLRMPVPRGANPVVLETGFTNSPEVLDTWRRSLEQDGFEVHVHADPEHGLGDIDAEALRLDGFVDAILARHPAGTRVDVVGYSSGITAARAWMSLHGGAGKLQRLVDLDGSWRGDDDSKLLARIASVPLFGRTLRASVPVAFDELQRGSELFGRLAAHPDIPAGVQVTTISSPHTAAANAVEGARNLVVPTRTSHAAMGRRSVPAYEFARDALRAPARHGSHSR